MSSLFVFFRDSAQRRRALAAPSGAAERYALFGLDQLRERGWAVRHNLEPDEPAGWARFTGSSVKRTLEAAGGYGGDFATVLGSLRTANKADVVLSTVDTVGIPLMLAKRRGFLRPPLVYVAIGLPERLARLGSERMRRAYAAALGSASAVVAYSEHEAAELSHFLAEHGQAARVEFVPFGVDTEAFRLVERPPEGDVVSVGADPHRDYDLLLGIAAVMPDTSFEIVTTADRARELSSPPTNVKVERDLPFEAMRARLERARLVALPVRENSYSGATTVLLQAMALGKPVVVTRTQAIATGYGLVDGDNCRLVAPGDEDAFGRALRNVLENELHGLALGRAARELAERELGWDRYVDAIERLLRGAERGPAA